METLATIGYILLCVLLFSLAIAIHEFGHFIVALKLGLNVTRFSLGFGPAIWKKKWRGVEYRVSWIPLGGYVMIPDIDPEGTKALEGERGTGNGERGTGNGEQAAKAEIAPWKEIAVAFAGPAMNLVLAFIVALAISFAPGARFGVLPATVGEVLPGGPAEAAGMKVGDRIVSVAGHPVDSWSGLQTEVQILGPKEGEIVVERGGERIPLKVTPKRDETTDIVFIEARSERREAGVPGSFLPARNPWEQVKPDAGGIFRVLKALVTPREMKATGQALTGPVGIAQGIYNSLRSDFWNGLGFLRFLNVNLAVINLLPIPVLDGGLILFALIALVFRRRVPEKVVSTLSMAFMCLLLLLMAFLIYRDSARTWRMHRARQEIELRSQTGAADAQKAGAPEVENADKAADKVAEGR